MIHAPFWHSGKECRPMNQSGLGMMSDIIDSAVVELVMFSKCELKQRPACAAS